MKHHKIRSYIIAGLLVWLPILATLVVIRFIIDALDSTLKFLPAKYQPDMLLGLHIPGFGLVLSIAVLILTGMFVTNFIGKRLFDYGESILAKIPLIRTIYHAVKQVSETIFSSSSQAFRKVLLVEYPRKGLWSIAFLTGTTTPKINNKAHDDLITIFIPTTPNPTSGFLMMLPTEDIIELDMTIDEALKMVISLGVMQPGVDRNGVVVTR